MFYNSNGESLARQRRSIVRQHVESELFEYVEVDLVAYLQHFVTELFGDENVVHVVVEKENFVLLDRLVPLRGDLGHHGRQMILLAEEIIVVDVASEVRRVAANDNSIGLPGKTTLHGVSPLSEPLTKF